MAVYRNFCCIADSSGLIIVQFAKYKKLKKKYDKFMKGKDGKSLEKDIIALFEDNKFIKSESEKNRKDIRNILKNWNSVIRRLDW